MIHFIFKKKTNLTDVFPEGYIDIHSHILPGLDDGAKHFEESLAILSRLTTFGISKFITTPHIMHGVYDNCLSIITSTTSRFKSNYNEGFSLKSAAEYLIDEHFEKSIAQDSLITLDGKHVLVELSYAMPPLCLHSAIRKLKHFGYVPVLAHPERYRYYHKTPIVYQELKHAGCKFQLNLLSLTGYYGKSTQKVAQNLISEGFIDYSGTDVHNMQQVEALNKPFSITEKLIRRILENNMFFDF
ncbi:tyrosine-protein phosphatase [Flavobacterium sp. AG291]|uniref:tyrosine-protein phosphatase n=1 Tax=Flavobacterium sp. AG291 TaxID=2184000 RepID=UPI000E0BB0B4|nr:CpsB/CapC family capsule biosynthesis tyrosine phosphatase [Flavobacterium sp. AG291]RDI11217.1 tyrosine-protein phosphatase YwqE [Flavobacterium sp. AG291]